MMTLTIFGAPSFVAMIPVAWMGNSTPGWAQTQIGPGGSTTFQVSGAYAAAIAAWATTYGITYTLA